MISRVLLSLVCIATLAAITPAAEAKGATTAGLRRYALVIGSNTGGGSGRDKLRYAGHDADTVADVLQQLGGDSKLDLALLSEPNRDTHLRSDDFFAADRYPTLTFTSTKITPRGGELYDVEGELTIRDVTKQVVLPVTHLGSATDPWGNQKIAFEAETSINRKDYGLNWNAALETGGFLVGDEVKISLSIQAA